MQQSQIEERFGLYSMNSMCSLWTEVGGKTIQASKQIRHKLMEFIRWCDFQRRGQKP